VLSIDGLHHRVERGCVNSESAREYLEVVLERMPQDDNGTEAELRTGVVDRLAEDAVQHFTRVLLVHEASLTEAVPEYVSVINHGTSREQTHDSGSPTQYLMFTRCAFSSMRA
jgi:DNA-directed RNA polymerase specialized sigma54-like protein